MYCSIFIDVLTVLKIFFRFSNAFQYFSISARSYFFCILFTFHMLGTFHEANIAFNVTTITTTKIENLNVNASQLEWDITGTLFNIHQQLPQVGWGFFIKTTT